jgi:Stress responsive A/B Barrel Domain
MKSTLRRISIGFGLVAVFLCGFISGQNKFGQPKSIVHVVTVEWKADSTPEQRQKAIDGVKQMAAEIPGMKNIWLKTLKVQGPSDNRSLNAAFVMEFADQASFDAYADHPAHKKWESIYLPIRGQSRTHDITN